MNTGEALKFLMKLEIKGIPLGWYVFLFLILVVVFNYVRYLHLTAKQWKNSTSVWERSQVDALIEMRNKVILYFLLFILFVFVFVVPSMKSNYYDRKRRSHVAPTLPRRPVRNVGIRYNNPLGNFLNNRMFSGVNVRRY